MIVSILTVILYSVLQAPPTVHGFGENVTFTDTVHVNASQLPEEVPEVLDFDVYVKDGSDYMNLTFLIPIRNLEDVPGDFSDFWIIDFVRYTPTSNPIDNNTLLVSRTSNCSNLNSDTYLGDLFIRPEGEEGFSEKEDLENLLQERFFQPGFVNLGDDEGKMNTILTYSGPLKAFSNCMKPGGGDIWIETQTDTGVEYSATMYANNIATIKNLDEDSGQVTYYSSHFSTTYVLKWKVSQYIMVNSLVSSIKRVDAELVHASVQPEWVEGKVTGRTVVHLAIRTVLSNGYKESVMMRYVNGSGWFDGLLHGNTIASTTTSQPSHTYTDTPCEYGFTSDDDCEQSWHFQFLIEDDLSGQETINGMFFFDLEFLSCDSLASIDYKCSSPYKETGHETSNEVISAKVQLDTVVQKVSEKENTLGLVVSSITSADRSANFMKLGENSRGIYHKEKVVILVNPRQNYEPIIEHGIRLTAFIVCFESVARTRMGCLDVEPRYRYIAHIEDNIRVTMNGKEYTRKDFEDPKQELDSHEWNVDQQTYEISFINLALSGQSRTYKITMLFRIDADESGTENSKEEISKRSRGSATEVVTVSSDKREYVIDADNASAIIISTTEQPETLIKTELPKESNTTQPQSSAEPAESLRNKTEAIKPITPAQEDPIPNMPDETEPAAAAIRITESPDEGDDKQEIPRDDYNKDSSETSATIPVQPCEPGHRFVDMYSECVPHVITRNKAGTVHMTYEILMLLVLLHLLNTVPIF